MGVNRGLIQIGKTNPVLCNVCCHKMRAFKHCKAVISKSVFVPIPAYGHNSWVMTERIDIILSASGRDGIFVKSPRYDTSRQSVQLWNAHCAESECRTTSPCRKILATLARSCVQNAPRKSSETRPAGLTPGKVAQRSSKKQAEWQHLRHPGSNLGVEPKGLPEIAVDREVFRFVLGLLPTRHSQEGKGAWIWMNDDWTLVSSPLFFVTLRFSIPSTWSGFPGKTSYWFFGNCPGSTNNFQKIWTPQVELAVYSPYLVLSKNVHKNRNIFHRTFRPISGSSVTES